MMIPRLNNADFIEAERELCSRDIIYFLRQAWGILDPGQPYQHGWHMEAMAEHLRAVADGEIKRLLINVPPGTSKSTMTGIIFPSWLWGPYGWPESRFIGASHEAGLAGRDSRRTRLVVESEWFQTLWPTKLTGDANAKTYFENEKRGFRQAAAVASMTGKRADILLWDDPHSPEKAYSKAYREESHRVFSETLPTRLTNPKKSAIIVVMQRLHEEDISGYILANDLGYEHLCLPMEFDPQRKCTTSIGWSDPRKEDGELLFPERFPREVVDRDKKALGTFATAGQFQQRPTPIGGGIIKTDWFRFIERTPVCQSRTIFADTAQKTSTSNDWSVFQCWGKTAEGQAVLLDMIRGKWEAPELLVNARAFWAKHKLLMPTATLREMRVEDAVSGTGLIQTLRREGMPINGIKRNKDKLTRAMDAAPFIESGNVLILRDCPHLSDMLSEATAFPYGAHDDTLDPMMDAVMDAARSSGEIFGVL